MAQLNEQQEQLNDQQYPMGEKPAPMQWILGNLGQPTYMCILFEGDLLFPSLYLLSKLLLRKSIFNHNYST